MSQLDSLSGTSSWNFTQHYFKVEDNLSEFAGEVMSYSDLLPQQSVQTSPRNSHGLYRRHTIYAAMFEWKTTYMASQTMSRVTCRWEGESVNHGRGNCYARRSLRINTLHSCVHPLNRTTGPLLAWSHLEERCLEARCKTTQISRGFIRTLPCEVCAGDVSRVSFLDLFGPVAIQLCNHFYGE